jgi:hypothetical protein
MIKIKSLFSFIKIKCTLFLTIWNKLPSTLKIIFRVFFVSFVLLKLLDRNQFFILEWLYNLFGCTCFISRDIDFVLIKLVIGFLTAFLGYLFRENVKYNKELLTTDLAFFFKQQLKELLFFKNRFYTFITISLMTTLILNNFLFIFNLVNLNTCIAIGFLSIILLIIFIINFFRITIHEVDVLFDSVYDTKFTNYNKINNKSQMFTYYKSLLK